MNPANVIQQVGDRFECDGETMECVSLDDGCARLTRADFSNLRTSRGVDPKTVDFVIPHSMINAFAWKRAHDRSESERQQPTPRFSLEALKIITSSAIELERTNKIPDIGQMGIEIWFGALARAWSKVHIIE